MDGPMGTQLQSLGELNPGECAELLNLTDPEVVAAVHGAYVLFGAECLLTNTFQANPYTLARHGHQDFLEDICQTALRLARQEEGNSLVLADVGPIQPPGADAEVADVAALRRVAGALAAADGVLLETWSSPQVLDAAALLGSWPETRHLPVLASLTYRRHPDGRVETGSGHEPEWFARRAKDHGVAVLGVNCGRDMRLTDVAEVVRRYRQETDLPLLARPNAGQPSWIDGRYSYPLDRSERAHEVLSGFRTILDAGATLIGGCCGLTPSHIGLLGVLMGKDG
jgi:methionine synthase I (cobalamin-dependent)